MISRFFVGTGANRRRSNVVKEIDRLKKNREERRAKQAEILEEKSAQKNVDPGNPNWEFLCMIRDYQEQLEFNPLQVEWHIFYIFGLLYQVQTDSSKVFKV